MPTPEELKQKVKELIVDNKLEFVGCKPKIQNYGVDRKGEWVVLDNQKYYFKKATKKLQGL